MTDDKGAQTADSMGLPPLRDVLIDFDGTLMKFGWPNEKDLGEPYPGVVEAMNLLRARGYVSLFSQRGRGVAGFRIWVMRSMTISWRRYPDGWTGTAFRMTRSVT